VPKPLRRFITPDRVWGKALKLVPFSVFDQTFFEKVCAQAFFEKACD
jgi:hypothetical protein